MRGQIDMARGWGWLPGEGKKMREPVGSRQVYKGEIEEKLSRSIDASQQEKIILYCAFYCQWLLFEKDHDVRKCRFIYGLNVCK